MKRNIEVTWDQLTQDTSQKVFYEEIVFWKLIVVCLIVIFVVVVVIVEVVIAIFLVVVIIILMLSVIIIIVVIIVVAVMKANDWKLAWQTYYWLLILLTWILIAHCLATFQSSSNESSAVFRLGNWDSGFSFSNGTSWLTGRM